MQYHPISLEHDPRKAHFAYFSAMQNPYVGLTAEVDAGPLLDACHRKNLPFSLAMVWCTGRAANAVPELRQRILNGSVVEFDHCDTSHTVLRPNGSYAYCSLDPMQQFAAFLPEAQRRQAEAIANGGIDDGEDALGLLFLSSIPWLHYTAITQPTPVPADSNPRITWSKYELHEGRLSLPVTLLVNHALADGLHIAQFFEALQDEMAGLAKHG